MEYITAKEAASKWGISTIRVTVLANEGRIPGAQKLGKSWLIPTNATKPPELKPNRSSAKKTNAFSFPLYHFRPDWCYIKDSHLSKQQQQLLSAETAVLECRFSDAYPILADILNAPDDICIEVGALWNMGICCIGLNKPTEFPGTYLRLQMILSEDFPHRDDLTIIFDALKTYVQTIGSASHNALYDTNIHDQALPLTCLQFGYTNLSKEAINPGSTDITGLQLNLCLLRTTSANIVVEMLHCYLLGIFYLRHDIENAKKHANAAVQIAYDNHYYFPIVTYYRYFSAVLSSVLDQYPADFQKHCHELIEQYETNLTSFCVAIDEDAVMSKLTDEDYLYILAILTGSSNADIAAKMGISPPTVSTKIARICNKLGIKTKSKKELKDYLRNYL